MQIPAVHFQMALVRNGFNLFLFPPSLSQPSHRWATTSVPSSRRHWCGASPCQVRDQASSWTASSRCAPNSRAWHRSSGREIQPWRATSASTTKTSSLVPSAGSCEPHSTDNPFSTVSFYYSGHMLLSSLEPPSCWFVYMILASALSCGLLL